MTPTRIQRRREKGWKMPKGAIEVSRPSKWGNPYKVAYRKHDGRWAIAVGGVYVMTFTLRRDAVECAVQLYRGLLEFHGGLMTTYDTVCGRDIQRMAKADLRGHHLACWCRLCPAHKDGKPLGVECAECEPCHADILLAIANQQPPTELKGATG